MSLSRRLIAAGIYSYSQALPSFSKPLTVEVLKRCSSLTCVNVPSMLRTDPNDLVTLQDGLLDSLVTAIHDVSNHDDPIFREFAASRIRGLVDEARLLASGQIVFLHTETWRAAYERLLLDLDFSTYFSVAWVRSSQYWRDQAGRRSIRLNYELLDRGLRIERILLLPESLWPRKETAPSTSIRTWIEEQHFRGVSLSLVREQDIHGEPDLLRDFGIYGNRATGEQELDDQARTIRFLLAFGRDHVQRACDRWNRLQLFSVPYCEALDL